MLQGCEVSVKLSSEYLGRVSFSSAADELDGDVIGQRKAGADGHIISFMKCTLLLDTHTLMYSSSATPALFTKDLHSS